MLYGIGQYSYKNLLKTECTLELDFDLKFGHIVKMFLEMELKQAKTFEVKILG